MIRSIIVDNGPYILGLIILCFVISKVYLLYSKGLAKNFTELFYLSLVPISKQGIKNTFQDKVKSYYKVSNKVNYFFYVVFAFAALVFGMMKAI